MNYPSNYSELLDKLNSGEIDQDLFYEEFYKQLQKDDLSRMQADYCRRNEHRKMSEQTLPERPLIDEDIVEHDDSDELKF